MHAETGTILLTAPRKKNTWITVLQDIEYVHSQLFKRALESMSESLTCLPEALTIIRDWDFREVAPVYFDVDEECLTSVEYNEKFLGED